METTPFEIEGEGADGKSPVPQQQLAALDQLFDSALGAFISVLDEHTLAEMMKSRRGVAGTEPAAKKQRTRSRPAAKPAGPYRRQQSSLR
ncbi:MAG: hypothetical protein WDN31_01150 [Hyphomicrobium sp.]